MERHGIGILDQWLNKHQNWFMGAADFTPCHNNALESSNRYLKVINYLPFVNSENNLSLFFTGSGLPSQAIRPKLTARKLKKAAVSVTEVEAPLSQPAITSKVTGRRPKKAVANQSLVTGAKAHESFSQPANGNVLSSQSKVTGAHELLSQTPIVRCHKNITQRNSMNTKDHFVHGLLQL